MEVKMEDLHHSGNFELIETVDYTSITGFVKQYISPRVPVMKSFYVFLCLAVLVFVYLLVYLFAATDKKAFSLLGKAIAGGFIFMIPMIPLHELLHGLAFRVLGAKKIIFGVNWKELVFYVTADKFVLSRKQFCFLALTPFVVFSILFVPFLFSSNPFIALLGSVFLLMHTMCCIGDFALMAYFSKGKGVEIYTYDDVSVKTTYFFRRIKQ